MRRHVAILLFALLTLGACRSRDSARPLEPKQIVDLSPPLTESTTCQLLGRSACDALGIPQSLSFRPVIPAKPDHSFGFMTYTLMSQEGAHLDAPGRLLRNGARVDEVPLKRLCGPMRLWDLRWHDRHSPLEITDLSQLSPVQPGDVLVLYTGYVPPSDDDWPLYTWLSPQAAAWLATKPIRALATDMPSIGNIQHSWSLLDQNRPPEEVWAVQIPFFQAGIPVIEGLTNLDELLHEKKVTFVGFPLPITSRSGAPMRAAALVY
jgi:kynurenine formamidase